MWNPEYWALKEWDYMQDVVFREADLMAPFERELEMAKQSCSPKPRRPLRWLGARLMEIGRRLDPSAGGVPGREPES